MVERKKQTNLLLKGMGAKVSESKSTDERRKEIVDAAKALFFSKGYEATSTVDIMKAVGIAKGTLYYHFSSKEEILDALIEDITAKMVANATLVKNRNNTTIVDRMVGVIRAISLEKMGDGAIIDVLHLPQNALFHQKSYALMVERISPIMYELVMEGISQGLFNTDYPEAAVHMAMSYSLTAFDDVSNPDEKMIKGLSYNLERLLGAPKGTLDKFSELFC